MLGSFQSDSLNEKCSSVKVFKIKTSSFKVQKYDEIIWPTLTCMLAKINFSKWSKQVNLHDEHHKYKKCTTLSVKMYKDDACTCCTCAFVNRLSLLAQQCLICCASIVHRIKSSQLHAFCAFIVSSTNTLILLNRFGKKLFIVQGVHQNFDFFAVFPDFFQNYSYL